MDKAHFDDKLNSLAQNYKTFKLLLIISMLMNIMLMIILVVNINKEKIILVPQVASENKLWLKQDQASNEYLSLLSRNVIDLMLNITPYNVEAQHQEVLKLVSSQHVATLKSKLDVIAKAIIDSNIAQNFYIHNIRVIHARSVIYVQGNLNEYIDKTLQSSNSQIYKLTFKVNNYGAQLHDFELIDAHDPQLKGLML